MQPIQNAGKRFHGLGTIAARIVQQDHAAIVSLLFDPLKDDIRPGLRPILRVDILQDHEIIEVFGNFQRGQFAKLRWTGIRRVRRAKQCGGATCYRFEQQLSGIQFKPDVLRPAQRQVRMVIGVVPDLVAFINNATNKPRIAFRVYTHQEKRRPYVRRFENI